MFGPTTDFTPKASGRQFPERTIALTCGTGLLVLCLALPLSASLSGVGGVLLLFGGLAMIEENYYRGVYRVKPEDEDNALPRT